MKLSNIIAVVALTVSGYAGYISYRASVIDRDIANFANLHSTINGRKEGCLAFASFYGAQDWVSPETEDIPAHSARDYAGKAQGTARALQLCQVRESGSYEELSNCVQSDVDGEDGMQYWVRDKSPSGNIYDNPIC